MGSDKSLPTVCGVPFDLTTDTSHAQFAPLESPEIGAKLHVSAFMTVLEDEAKRHRKQAKNRREMAKMVEMAKAERLSVLGTVLAILLPQVYGQWENR